MLLLHKCSIIKKYLNINNISKTGAADPATLSLDPHTAVFIDRWMILLDII